MKWVEWLGLMFYFYFFIFLKQYPSLFYFSSAEAFFPLFVLFSQMATPCTSTLGLSLTSFCSLSYCWLRPRNIMVKYSWGIIVSSVRVHTKFVMIIQILSMTSHCLSIPRVIQAYMLRASPMHVKFVCQCQNLCANAKI